MHADGSDGDEAQAFGPDARSRRFRGASDSWRRPRRSGNRRTRRGASTPRVAGGPASSPVRSIHLSLSLSARSAHVGSPARVRLSRCLRRSGAVVRRGIAGGLRGPRFVPGHTDGESRSLGQDVVPATIVPAPVAVASSCARCHDAPTKHYTHRAATSSASPPATAIRALRQQRVRALSSPDRTPCLCTGGTGSRPRGGFR